MNIFGDKYEYSYGSDFIPTMRYANHMFYVYMLRCADNTFYTGSTIDLVKRLHAHNSLSGGAKYTKMRRPVVLIHTEEYETFAESRRREAEIKRMTRAKKLQLINGDLKRGIAK